MVSNKLKGYRSSPGYLLDINGGRMAFVEGNSFEMPGFANMNVCRFTATEVTKFLCNRVEGDSSGELVAQINSGRLEKWGNTIINNGSGGTGYQIIGTATVADMI